MTVTRYKRDRSTETIRDAVLGVIRNKREAQPAEPAKPAPSAGAVKARSEDDLVKHHAAVTEPMRINPTTLARAKTKRRAAAVQEQAIRSSFRAYEPPPNVLPQGAKPDMALDSALQGWADQSATNAWNFSGSFSNSFAEGIGFLGYAYLSQLTERPEYRRISDRIAIEMTRKWIRLTISGEADPEKTDTENAEDRALGYDRQPDADLKVDDDEEEDADGAAAGGAVADTDDDQDDEPSPEEIAQRKRNEALAKKLKEIEEDMRRLDVRGKFKTIAEFDGYMGRSHLYIDTGKSDDPEELKSDLGNGSDKISKEKFEKGSLRNIKPIEAIWCYPVNYNANDPLADDWYNPQVWFAMAKQIHVSRLLTFVGRPLPDILKPSYAFGGLSLSQMAKPYVDNWLRTRQAVTALIESFSVSGIYTNAQSLLQGGGEEVLDRIDMFNASRTNSGALVLDKDSEEFFNISTPLGTLDQLQAQSQEQMSAVSGIPLIVLLGITPHGLNASSEGELRVFYDLIHAMQESLFRDKLKRVIDFIQLHLYGEVDPAIGFEFEPLWSLDEKGEAEVRKIKAETHMIYVDGGVVGTEEIRKIEIEDDNSPYTGLDPDNVPDLKQEEADGLGGAGAPPGGGGGESSNRADNKEVDGAADQALIDLGDDTFAFDDGQFDESKVKRDAGGKFSETEGGGAKKEDEPAFKTKKEHIAHLLGKGTTPKEIMQAMNWPSVSMPAQAKSLGLKLEKKDGKYFGLPMTDAEKAEVKAAAKKNPELAAKVVSAVAEQNPGLKAIIDNAEKLNKKQDLGSMAGQVAPKLNEKPTPNALEEFMSGEGGTYPKFLGALAEALQKNDTDTAGNLLKFNPAFAKQLSENMKPAMKQQMKKMGLLQEEKPKPAVPQATPEELKKAQKTAPLQMKYVPNASSLDGNPEAQKLVDKFNAKWANKTVTESHLLEEKIDDFKALNASMLPLLSQAEKKKAEQAAVAKEKADKEAKEKLAAEMAEMNDPEVKAHYEVLQKIGVSKQYWKEAESIIKKNKLSITPQQGAYIIAYRGHHYDAVNEQLWADVLDDHQAEYAAALDDALDKMPVYEGTVTRGIKSIKTEADLAKYKAAVGKVKTEKGFSSAGVKDKLWGKATMHIQSKTARDIRAFNPGEGGGEVVFKKGTQFRILKVVGWNIYAEEFIPKVGKK